MAFKTTNDQVGGINKIFRALGLTPEAYAEGVAVERMPNLLIANVELTRPSDANAYLAGDAIANSTTAPTLLEFTNMVRQPDDTGYITKARMTISNPLDTGVKRLWLYSDTNVGAVVQNNDNDPFTLNYGNRASRIGYIDFGPLVRETPTSDSVWAMVSDMRLAYRCVGQKSLFGRLLTPTAYTPTSAQKYFIELWGDAV